ncbi:MAG: GTP-binding protein EngB [Candidatus Thorarchaeota archaeon]|nr:GTP-binding protein EngB [Candidatus Thorarchaeota archaeon]
MNARKVSGPKRKKPIIVFAGRSNVGKSSTIRGLTGKKIRVGKHPGSTRWEQTIDMGSVDFVDIPGFGFMSRSSKDAIEDMKNQIIGWLEDWSDQMAVAVLVIDISLFQELVERWGNRGEIPIEVEFYSFLSEIAPAVIVVANKIDRLKKKQISGELEYLQQQLIEATPSKEPNVVTLSALKRSGFENLKESIEKILQTRGINPPDW